MYRTHPHTRAIALGIVVGIGAFCCTGLAAADAAPAVSCTSLHVNLSSDKNSYVFTAAASGNAAAVTGYTFGFGDRQSYTLQLGSQTKTGRLRASVTHAYQKSGTYDASVHVLTKNNSLTSPACRAKATAGAPATLPNTGTASAVGLFAAASALAAVTHWVWQRQRRAPLQPGVRPS